MSRLVRLLVITFIESFATILIERGLYFYSHERLAFTNTENLWLSLGFGVAYAVGALASHGLSRRLTEKPLLLATVVGQVLVHVALVLWHGPYALAVANIALGGLNGLKWPVVESYVSAGRTPADQASTVGRFNLSWAVAVPLSLVFVGPLVAWRADALFALAAALNVVTLALARPLERRPVHLAADHPDQPSPGAMVRYKALLASSRWSMLGSYALMWILAAVFPHVLAGLGFGIRVATALSGLLDVVRCGTFLALQLWRGWHNRAAPLAAVILALPVGFFMILFGSDLATVLAGELVFGVAAGMTYYAALYYAMIVKNASVEAGGAHEGLIGTGFAIGPVAALVGGALAPALGGPVPGMVAGIGPVLLTCAVGAVWFLAKVRRRATL